MRLLFDSAVGLVLLALLCISISKKCREKMVDELAWTRPFSFWSTSAILVLICIIPLGLKYRCEGDMFAPLIVYFFVPALVLTLKHYLKWDGAADLLIAAAIFVPAAYRWIPAWTGTTMGIPIAYWGMSIYLLTAFAAQSDLEMHVTWKWNRHDAKLVLAMIPILFAAIVPLAMYAHFLAPGMGWLRHNAVWKIPLIFLGSFFTVAIPEEIFCRVVMQGTLARWLGNAWGIFLTSIVFGLGHITLKVSTSQGSFGYPNWWYVLFAVIASVGYGYVYYKRRSLIACATLHASVDFIWFIFFRN